jgi:hypothetical protein
MYGNSVQEDVDMRYFIVVVLALLCTSLFAADATVKSNATNWLITVGGEEYAIPKTVDMEVAVEAAKQQHRGVKPVQPTTTSSSVVAAAPVPRVAPVETPRVVQPVAVFNPLTITTPSVVCRT